MITPFYPGVALIREDFFNPGNFVTLEPGVGRLILILERLGFVSQQSCEGHDMEVPDSSRFFRSSPYVMFGSINEAADLKLLRALSVLCNYARIEFTAKSFVLRIMGGISRKVINDATHLTLEQLYGYMGGGEEDALNPSYISQIRPAVPESKLNLEKQLEVFVRGLMM